MYKLTKNLLPAILLLFQFSVKAQNKIGHWAADNKGLPVFQYTGVLPFTALNKMGEPVKLPTDPWFILGNYRGTVFAHVSGEYQLINGERTWASINLGDKAFSCGVRSSITFGSGHTYSLAGLGSAACDPKLCERKFGCGFADYKFAFPEGITCERIISSKPSANPKDGVSAILLTIIIKNNTPKATAVNFNEGIRANYTPLAFQRTEEAARPVQYKKVPEKMDGDQLVATSFVAESTDPLILDKKEDEVSNYEIFPPSLYMRINAQPGLPATLTNKMANDGSDWLQMTANGEILPGGEKRIQLTIGYTFDKDLKHMEEISGQLKADMNDFDSFTFRDEWYKILPLFKAEKDDTLKRELTWDAYCLETMAHYNQFYKETCIPQGTQYDYDWGQSASARDHLQHLLPLCYYNPALAKSALRYTLEKVTPWGEVRLIENAAGSTTDANFNADDQQIYLLYAIATYLKVTKDYAFLSEKINFYPSGESPSATVSEVITRAFEYLRDEIGTGAEGLVHLRCADWNDLTYFMLKNVSYPAIVFTAESHLATAQAIVVTEQLANILDSAGRESPAPLVASLRKYSGALWVALNKDWGNAPFLPRFYVQGKKWGTDEMWIEPQVFALQIAELSIDRKKALYKEIEARVGTGAGEKTMARQQESPQTGIANLPPGNRENGGLWYALHGPLIVGVATWDKQEATKLLKQMSFATTSALHPDYWVGYWTAADAFESSLTGKEGLPDQTAPFDFPAFCAHAHAWLLYAYFKINE